MSKQIEFSDKARKKILKGVDILADAVGSTLGPNGRNVLIEKVGVPPSSTKDGVTVAKEIELEDALENMGAQTVKQAASKTNDLAGDGTTTATVLAREIIKEGLQYVDKGTQVTQLKRDIDSSVQKVINHLRENIVEDISNENQLEHIASISANNDPEIGKLVATAFEKVGMEGAVHVEESKTGENYLETVEGMQFERGYKSPYFVTDNNTMTSTLTNPYILIANERFTQVKELLPILEGISSQGRPLLIIAEDVDGEALATLIVNKMRGIMNVCAVKAPEFGERRSLVLEDIAITTGGQVFDKKKGMKLDKFSYDWLGEARTVTISKEDTTIVDGKGNEEQISSRIEELQYQIDKSKTPFEREKLQDRLAKFTGGVAVVHVGGYTETEMKERKDRVDDALHATRAALEEGIVPGGGTALLYAREILRDDFASSLGSQVVYKACGKPFNQILTNAGYNNEDIYYLATHKLINSGNDYWAGYNLKTKEVENMKSAGIIDPFKVTRTALENASSVASTILLTECAIVEEKNENEQPQGGMPMGMM
jgi:chaperonin GroEL